MGKALAESIRYHDEQGQLQAAGAEWGEDRYGLSGLTLLVTVFGTPFALLAVAFASDNAHRSEGAVGGAVAAAAFAIVIGLNVLRWLLGDKTRAVIFNDDGTIELPYGRTHNRFRRNINGHHRYIASIEARKSEFSYYANRQPGYEVCLYSTGGDMAYLAMELTYQQAHKISVTLMHALTEMRDSAANAGGHRDA